MARIGMLYPYFAPITSHTEGSAIVYGTGSVVAHAIAATLTENRRNNPLYGDDIKVENDKGLTDYTLSFEADNLTPAMRSALLGDEAVTGSGSTVSHYSVNDDNAPYVGFGYIRKVMLNGVIKFEAIWFHKIQFSVDAQEDNTKGETVSWGTARITGSGSGVYLDNTGKVRFYKYAEFTTESAAKTWLEACAT